MAKMINASTALSEIANNKLDIFDTRDALHFRDGTIPGAYNVSMYNMSNILNLQNNKILVTGDDKQHTDAIITQLESLGFKKLFSLNTSIDTMLGNSDSKPAKPRINTTAQKKRAGSKMLRSVKTNEPSVATVTYKKKRIICDSTE
jgi:rhodanese-related sulfurtransferase